MNRDIAKRKESEATTANPDTESRRPRIFPAYEVWDGKNSIHLRLEMPGLERENVHITVENNELVIQGRRPDWTVDGTVLLRERRVGDYYRAFTLDTSVDTDRIDATMRNGILEITLGYAKEAQPRRIEIKSA